MDVIWTILLLIAPADDEWEAKLNEVLRV